MPRPKIEDVASLTVREVEAENVGNGAWNAYAKLTEHYKTVGVSYPAEQRRYWQLVTEKLQSKGVLPDLAVVWGSLALGALNRNRTHAEIMRSERIGEAQQAGVRIFSGELKDLTHQDLVRLRQQGGRSATARFNLTFVSSLEQNFQRIRAMHDDSRWALFSPSDGKLTWPYRQPDRDAITPADITSYLSDQLGRMRERRDRQRRR